MTKIQQTSQHEPLLVTFSVKRKSDVGSSTLTPYSFTVYSPDGGSSIAGPFNDAFFVPIFQQNDGDYTTVAFAASFAGTYSDNYAVQCQWDFGDGNKTSIYNRQTNIDAFNAGSYDPVYYRFKNGGPGGTASYQRVTFSVIDRYNRKTIVSTSVYPKVGA